MSQSPLSFEFSSQPLRVILCDGEPWFVAADLLVTLSLDRKAMERLDDDEKGVSSIHTPGGEQEMSIVNESGLYSLILGSRKPVARKYKKWVTGEVLPTIRKTGRYEHPAAAAAALPAPAANPDALYINQHLIRELGDRVCLNDLYVASGSFEASDPEDFLMSFNMDMLSTTLDWGVEEGLVSFHQAELYAPRELAFYYGAWLEDMGLLEGLAVAFLRRDKARYLINRQLVAPRKPALSRASVQEISRLAMAEAREQTHKLFIERRDALLREAAAAPAMPALPAPKR